MRLDDHLDAIRVEGHRFWDAIASASLDAPVPCCPDWTARDLGWHLARVHWFWAAIVEGGITDPTELRSRRGEQPDDARDERLVPFGREMHAHLLDVFAHADPATRAWTWTTQQDVAFIIRHQVQEAAVHRVDAQRAARGDADPIEASVAVDAVDEFLTLARPSLGGDVALSGSVHLHCTDADGEWFVHPDGRVEAIHAKGDVALRATASNLLLALYHRVALDDLDVIGDRALAESFLSPQVG